MAKPGRKEEIKSLAARLFRERGYSATSMRDIAKEMGIEAPSLYNHISSKQQILSELLMAVAHRFTEGMQAVKSSAEGPRAMLEDLVRLHVGITLENPDAIALLTGEYVHLEGKQALDFSSLKDKYEQDFRAIITAGISAGELPDVDVDLTMFSILSSLRMLHLWQAKHRYMDKEEQVEQLIRLLLPRPH